MWITTVVVLSVALLSLLTTVYFHQIVLQNLDRKPPPAEKLPPISILKPVKGLDDGLYENLVSLVRQDYPEFEVIIGAEHAGDPALEVAARVRQEHPEVRIILVAGFPAFGANPKVRSLAALERWARYETVLISDSNIRARPDYLTSTVRELAQDGVGLVGNLLLGVGERNLGALLENLQLNSWVISAVMAAERIAGHPCIIGKSMLFRRSQFHALCGWETVKDVLAEDYVIGQRFHRAGFKVVNSRHILPTVSEQRRLRDFFSRHLRWSQMRFWVSPLSYLGEPLMNPIVWWAGLAIMASISGSMLGLSGVTWIGFAIIVALLKVMSEMRINEILRGVPLSRMQALAIPFKDFLIFVAWALGMVRRTVYWRGHRMRIGAGSLLSPLDTDDADEAVKVENLA